MSDRRTFLRTSTAAVSAAAVTGAGVACGPAEESASGAGEESLDTELLDAVAEVVLPAELGQSGRTDAVVSFQAWCTAYEPVAELNHGYGTSQIRYLPEHPQPRWVAQLTALDLEAQKRFEAPFASLDLAVRAELVSGRLVDASPSLGRPHDAEHVAAALLAHWAASPEATDLCYGTAIAKLSCRGLDALESDQ